MATSDDEKESGKQAHKPASKDVRETKVERTTSGAVRWYRSHESISNYVKVGDKLNELKRPQGNKASSNVEKSDFDTYADGDDSINIYEKSYRYDNVGLLNNRVTSLASHISSSYSLDWKESEKLARVASAAIDRAVAEHRAGKPLSLEPTFTPAAGGADAQTSSLTLPDAPPKYPYAPRMEGGIVKYLEDNWASYIEAGLLSRPDLRRIDPAAYEAFRNWIKNPKHTLPNGWVIPTKSQSIDRELSQLGGEERVRHLANAVASRKRRKVEPN